MIDLSTLRKEDIGRWVLYDDNFKKEKGRIKSWNEEFIFVVYKCNDEWDRFQDFTGCATNPEDLDFLIFKEKLKAGKMLFERLVKHTEDIIV